MSIRKDILPLWVKLTSLRFNLDPTTSGHTLVQYSVFPAYDQ